MVSGPRKATGDHGSKTTSPSCGGDDLLRVDLLAVGVIDPAKVPVGRLQNAVSIPGLFLTTGAVIADGGETSTGSGRQMRRMISEPIAAHQLQAVPIRGPLHRFLRPPTPPLDYAKNDQPAVPRLTA